MKICIKTAVCFVASAFLFSLSGCGGGGGSSLDMKGSVNQGPVSGATVFADRVVKDSSGSLISNFVVDPGEAVASNKTSLTGGFYFPTVPNYDFILVSTGGKDEISLQKALLLLAPAGSRNITPLTTLVTLDRSGKLGPLFKSLLGGAEFDSNVSTNSTAAALALVKSVELAVQRMRDVIDTQAAAAGITLDERQYNYIQVQIWQQIAGQFAAMTVQDLATPQKVDAALKVALVAAGKTIRSQNSNILNADITNLVDSFTTGSLTTIASNSVDLALGAIGSSADSTSTALLGMSAPVTELSVQSSIAVAYAAFSSSFSTISTLASIVVMVTPPAYNPTPIPVVTVDNATLIRILTGASGGFTLTGLTF